MYNSSLRDRKDKGKVKKKWKKNFFLPIFLRLMLKIIKRRKEVMSSTLPQLVDNTISVAMYMKYDDIFLNCILCYAFIFSGFVLCTISMSETTS